MKENGINSFNINNHPNDVFILNKEKMVVYRIDSRPAGTIMVDGFKPRGNNHDISTFILNPPDDAGFISTSISNPDEMLAQYQLRGFVIEAALDFASKNKLNFEDVKDPPPLVDMPLDWAFNRFKGESTALVYKIMLNPDQGIDVEKSTFLNSDKGHVFNVLILA